MGKLRVLSGQQVCRIMERHGFSEVRRRGSHVVMQRRTKEGQLPFPSRIIRNSRCTLLAIIRQSGIARSAFES
jgi:predicted RNA binding protein YcfA (HicA-like mRNA interferase family)